MGAGWARREGDEDDAAVGPGQPSTPAPYCRRSGRPSGGATPHPARFAQAPRPLAARGGMRPKAAPQGAAPQRVPKSGSRGGWKRRRSLPPRRGGRDLGEARAGWGTAGHGTLIDEEHRSCQPQGHGLTDRSALPLRRRRRGRVLRRKSYARQGWRSSRRTLIYTVRGAAPIDAAPPPAHAALKIMRAEIENLARSRQAVDRAAEEASLTGIAPQRRLAELNARAEDPNLWNDAEAAQKVMRERQALERPDRRHPAARAGARGCRRR